MKLQIQLAAALARDNVVLTQKSLSSPEFGLWEANFCFFVEFSLPSYVELQHYG